MIDKTKRKATVTENGPIIAIRMTGGPDCLWLNMYLDTEKWQMTCDSDIGFYAYRWGKSASRTENFREFCCRWLSDEEWLLRKCIGERHVDKFFCREQAENSLREMVTEYYDGDEEFDIDDFDDALHCASGNDSTAREWALAVQLYMDNRNIELPDEWYTCIEEDYTPWQKRFAEICREVIVPELSGRVTPEENEE